MDFKGNTIKRKIDDKPLCKYGLSCYRKNPEHRKKFKHPAEKDTKINGNKVDSSKICTSKKDVEQSVSAAKEIDETPSPEETHLDEPDEPRISVNVNDSLEETADNSIEEITDDSVVETVGEILTSMPKDFFDFWKFCSSVNKSKPEDAFSDCGYYLVGIFDLLGKKLPKDKKVDISCHWRYYFDPPEFQTVIKKDGSDGYHIGYFRDDPSKKPSILASNSAAKGPKLTLVGDNIFCAMNVELKKVIKSLDSKDSKAKVSKLKQLQKDLVKFATEKKYELNIKTEKTEKRRRKVVTKTFNGLGIVVPVKKDIGYRSLPDSDTVVKNMLNKIVSAENKTKQLEEQEALDELISNVHFANDELDYGMGLELGIDLFCHGDPYFHEDILRVLPLAYELLNRLKYAAVVRAHLRNRRKGDKLSTL